MKVQFEKISLGIGRSFRAFRYDAPRFLNAYHAHPEIELVHIIRGSGLRTVGDSIEPFWPGDTVLLGSSLPHSFVGGEVPGGVEAVVIQFLPDAFGRRFFELPELRSVGSTLSAARRGIRIRGENIEPLEAALREVVDATGPSRLVLLLNILAGVSGGWDDDCLLASASFRPIEPGADADRIERACAYIEQNLHEPLKLADVARVANLSPSAFSRFFRRTTRKGFVDYVNEHRIGRARRQLLETGRPITAIAFDAGFTNLSNFNRRFRERVGMSPRAYRKSVAAGNPAYRDRRP